ncbi:MAG: archaellin/type IV pilin N-terminal domain-containing protein [Vulcanisaeta sp. AZ3]|jgi:flagellin-like protein
MTKINRMNKRGISNVVATIILIAVAIALAVAVAVWVFGLAGSAAKTATLTIQATSLTNVSSDKSANITFVVSNPSSSGVGINGFTLGSLTCTFSPPIQVSAGTQGETITFTLTISHNGNFTGISAIIVGNTPIYSSKASSSSSSSSTTTPTCTGIQSAAVGVQYSGYLTTATGQTYPFTVTASS